MPEVPELRGARGKRPALLHGECDGAPSLSVGPGVGTSRERAPCAGQLIGRPARAALVPVARRGRPDEFMSGQGYRRSERVSYLVMTRGYASVRGWQAGAPEVPCRVVARVRGTPPCQRRSGRGRSVVEVVERGRGAASKLSRVEVRSVGARGCAHCVLVGCGFGQLHTCIKRIPANATGTLPKVAPRRGTILENFPGVGRSATAWQHRGPLVIVRVPGSVRVCIRSAPVVRDSVVSAGNLCAKLGRRLAVGAGRNAVCLAVAWTTM